MSKEKQIKEYKSKQLIDELSKMPPKVIATAYFHAKKKTLIGCRHDAAHQEIITTGFGDDKKVNSHYSPEQWSLLYEITYEDGHIERKWENCTRFEYKKAVEELEE